MSTASDGITRGLIMIALTATLMLPALATAQTPERRPMTVEDVRRMVAQGVRPQTILAALRQNCLAVYGLNEETLRELRAAGAERELLDGLSQVCWGAPGGPVIMDPSQPFVMITAPDQWSAESPQPFPARPGNQIRLQGLVHAPSGVERLLVNGTEVPLSNDPAGGLRFSTTVNVAQGMNAVNVVLHPIEGQAYQRMLPINTAAAAATPARGNVVDRPYNPGTVAMSGIIPGMAQFRTGNAVMGAIVLGAAGGAIAAGLSTETTVRCAADADPCPSNAILSEETERPYLIPGIAAAAGVTVLGAVLGYSAAKSANERAARSGAVQESAGVRLGQAVLERLPTPTPSGGWAFELARFEF